MGIPNNLLVRSIMSPELNMNDAVVVGNSTKGAINKQNLSNRIKKLSQNERKTLSDHLKAVSMAIQNPAETVPYPKNPKLQYTPRLEDLKELGVCALLLADNGSHVKPHNIFESIKRFLNNKCGDRISSTAIINQLQDVRAQLTKSGNAEAPVVLDDVARDLQDAHARLIIANQAPNGSDKINDMLTKLQNMQTFLIDHQKDAKEGEFGEFFAMIEDLGAFSNAHRTVFDDDRVQYLNAIFGFEKITEALFAAPTAHDAAQIIRNNGISVKKYLHNAFNVLINGHSRADDKDIKAALIRKVMIPYFINEITLASNKFKLDLEEIDQKKNQAQAEINDLKRRLDEFNNNKTVNVKVLGLNTTLASKKRAEEHKNDLRDVFQEIETLSQASNKSFSAFGSAFRLIYVKIQNGDIGKKNIDGIKGRMDMILGIFHGDNAQRQRLVNSMDLNKYNIQEADAHLYGILDNFRNNPAGYAIVTEQSRKELIGAYIAYMKIAYKAELEQAVGEFNKQERRVAELQAELDAIASGTPAPNLVAPVAAPPPARFATTITIKHNAGMGNNLYIYGIGINGMSWNQRIPLRKVDGDSDTWVFETNEAIAANLEYKIVKIEGANEDNPKWEKIDGNENRRVMDNNLEITPQF